MQCPYCNQEHPDGTRFCPRTGKNITIPGVCPACGQTVEPDWLHCGYCGQKLTPAEASPVLQQPVKAAAYPQVEASPVFQQPAQPAAYPHVVEPIPAPSNTRKDTSGRTCLLVVGGVVILLIVIVVALNLALSGPVAQVSARLTAAAVTSTPTRTLMPSPTATPLPTTTTEPTITPAFSLPPLAEGWRGYTVSGFYVAMPKEWLSVDVDKEGIQAILDAASGMNDDWAKYITQSMTSEDAQKMLKFWAYDTQSTGNFYVNANVVYQAGTVPLNVKDVCVQIPPAYQQMGIEVREMSCDRVINSLDAARIVSLYSSDTFTVIESQYFYVRGGDYWILTLTVQEALSEQYQPTFDAISETFMVGE